MKNSKKEIVKRNITKNNSDNSKLDLNSVSGGVSNANRPSGFGLTNE